MWSYTVHNDIDTVLSIGDLMAMYLYMSWSGLSGVRIMTFEVVKLK